MRAFVRTKHAKSKPTKLPSMLKQGNNVVRF